jgi:hypothetical protein
VARLIVYRPRASGDEMLADVRATAESLIK